MRPTLTEAHWKKAGSLVQGWGAVQINLGLCTWLDERRGSDQSIITSPRTIRLANAPSGIDFCYRYSACIASFCFRPKFIQHIQQNCHQRAADWDRHTIDEFVQR